MRSVNVSVIFFEIHGISNSLQTTLILMGIRVQFPSGTRGFVNYVIITTQNWTKYTYVDLVIKETVTHQT